MEIQLNVLLTLVAGGIVYWLGDWLAKHIDFLGRIRFPAPLLGGLIAAAVCVGTDTVLRFHETVQVALVYLASSALGFALRRPKAQTAVGMLVGCAMIAVWENRAVTLPCLNALRTTPGRLGAAFSLIAFCMFSGLMVVGSLSQLMGLPIPAWLGGLAVAALLRNTTEMTDNEFPDREMIGIGKAALGVLVSIAVIELVLRLPTLL